MSFTDQQVQAVWEKGRVVGNNDPNVWRKDDCEAWIHRRSYGNRESQYGWEIDHITPESQGGTDDIDNLRPLQWENNATRQDDPNAPCAVTASGTANAPARR